MNLYWNPKQMPDAQRKAAQAAYWAATKAKQPHAVAWQAYQAAATAWAAQQQ